MRNTPKNSELEEADKKVFANFAQETAEEVTDVYYPEDGIEDAIEIKPSEKSARKTAA